MRTLLATLFMILGCGYGMGAEYVWIEGEAPSQNPLNAPSAGVERSQYLSEGKWLFLNIPAKEVAQKVPAEGALVGYAFEVKKAGKYEVWNRIGMESQRSSFDWRLDHGEWKTIPAGDYPYTDLMDLAFWYEVSWVK